MEKVNDSQSVSSLRDRRTGLDPDLSGADSFIVSGRTSQLEFHSGTTREKSLHLKLFKQLLPVRRIRKKWTQEEDRIVMECYCRSKPKNNGYQQQMHAIWRDKGMFIITEQRRMDQ